MHEEEEEEDDVVLAMSAQSRSANGSGRNVGIGLRNRLDLLTGKSSRIRSRSRASRRRHRRRVAVDSACLTAPLRVCDRYPSASILLKRRGRTTEGQRETERKREKKMANTNTVAVSRLPGILEKWMSPAHRHPPRRGEGRLGEPARGCTREEFGIAGTRESPAKDMKISRTFLRSKITEIPDARMNFAHV